MEKLLDYRSFLIKEGIEHYKSDSKLENLLYKKLGDEFLFNISKVMSRIYQFVTNPKSLSLKEILEEIKNEYPELATAGSYLTYALKQEYPDELKRFHPDYPNNLKGEDYDEENPKFYEEDDDFYYGEDTSVIDDR